MTPLAVDRELEESMPKKTRIKANPGGRRMTEVLLAEAIPTLGNQGEIVRVRPGYARNYLLPQGLATIATIHNKRRVELHKQRQEAARVAQLKSWRELAERVAKYSVTLEANANKEGHLYGSIVATDISKQLVSAGYNVTPSAIQLDGHIKETGMYTVKVAFTADIGCEVKVWVVPKQVAAATT